MKAMKTLFVFLAALFMAGPIIAQNTDPLMRGFLFPEFEEGIIMLKDGGRISIVGNYDQLDQRIMYQEGTDYYRIDKTDDIAVVFIGDRTFVPEKKKKTFMEAIYLDKGRLYVKHIVEFKARSTETTLGKTQTGASQNLSSVTISSHPMSMSTNRGGNRNAGYFRLGDNKDMEEVYSPVYHVLNKNNHFVTVNSISSLAKVFGHKKEIAAYAADNKVKFNDLESIMKIVEYCYSLQ